MTPIDELSKEQEDYLLEEYLYLFRDTRNSKLNVGDKEKCVI